MSGNHRDGTDGGKITSLEEWQERRRGVENIEFLAEKMRRLRAAMPVNEELRRQLRQQLAGRLTGSGPGSVRPSGVWPDGVEAAGAAGRESAGQTSPGGVRTSRGRGVRWPGWRWSWLAVLGMVLLLVAGLIYYRQLPRHLVVTARQEMGGFLATGSREAQLQLAVPPQGDYLLAAAHGRLILLDRQGGQRAVLGQPQEQYTCPAISPDGQYLAVARTVSGRGTGICLVEMPDFHTWQQFGAALSEKLRTARRLSVPEEVGRLVNIYWAPLGPKLVFSGFKDGQNDGQIYITSWQEDTRGTLVQHTEFLTGGWAAGWSPDGRWLLLTRSPEGEEKIYLRPNPWLFTQYDGLEVFLGVGGRPLWLKDGYLLFVRPVQQEVVLTYSPDGLPGLVLRRWEEELCWVRPEGDFSRWAPATRFRPIERAAVLLPAESGLPTAVLEWVQRMEARGMQRARLALPPQRRYLELVAGEEKEGRRVVYYVLSQQQRLNLGRLELLERTGEEENNEQK
ncbi:MAG: TolB family protein [Desulfurispora sp.]|uniref:TolB family protein n=1 Tax=Desulfurispora sp. TaxID=3014275 RepID=UPI00404A081C